MESPVFTEIIPMRPDERIDPERVAKALAGQLPGVEGVPEIWQFEGGKANLTYLLRYPARQGEVEAPAEYVLRRPPLGPVAPKSHDMGREYQVLSVLNPAYPLAPKAFAYSEDTQVVGAPFLVMERRKGIVIRQEMPSNFLDQPALYQRMSEMITNALADLHTVDPHAIGLDNLGRPDGFMQRQIKGWAGRWDAAKTEEVPRFEEIHRWLESNTPDAQRVSLVHNDFKLDNMMVNADDPAQPVAVFDWDMCTLGDPLADLGTLLGYWTEAGDSDVRKVFAVMPSHLPGFFTREQVAESYARRSGLSLEHLAFYETFALWKTAVVIQQIYVRLHRGQTRDERFRSYGQRAKGLVDAAWEVMTRA